MKEQELIVTLISATNLPPTTKGQFRHPYCKVYLLPDRRSVYRTDDAPIYGLNSLTYSFGSKIKLCKKLDKRH